MTKDERRKTEAALIGLEVAGRSALRRGLTRIIALHATKDIAAGAVAAARDLEPLVVREVRAIRAAGATGGARTVRREVATVRPMPHAGPYRSMPMGSGIEADAIGRRAADLMAERASVSSLSEAAVAVRSRLDTIAATETSAAFHQGREQALREAVEAGLIERPTMQWSAVLDRQTCQLCASLHGETALLGDSFRGYTPGMVHARCRCVAYPLRRSLTPRMAA